jgi:riboflavin kinase/FMN adenylyltransferase
MFFEPQPQEFFHPTKCAPPRLMDWRDKFEALRDLGIDYVLIAD